MRLDWLYRVFEENRGKDFIAWRGRTFTYAWLLDSIAGWRATFEREGIGPGAVVAVEGDYSPRAISLVITLVEAGAIVVPLAGNVEMQREEFKRIAEVQVVVSFRDADEATIARIPGRVSNPLTRSLIDSGDPGLVVFTSGSTGKSKAALHNFARLLEKFQVRRHSLVTLTMLLLDHLGGLNTLFYILSNGGTIIAIETRDPERVCRAIDRYRVELLPTTPTFLNLLLISEAWSRHDLSSLKRVTYGTEVMPPGTLARLRHVLPGVEFQQTYGLSELGVLRTKSRSSDSLWVKVGGEGFETKIEGGTLRIRARSAMLGYLNAPSPFDPDGWFDTGDAVEVDGEYIRILGRVSEMINVGGEKVYPAEIEDALLAMPNVRDVVVTGAPSPITGQIVVARLNLFDPEEPAALRRRLREFCRGRLAPYKTPAKIEIADEAQYSERFKKMRRPVA